MGWPRDPVEREAYRSRLRAAQQRRWARPEERERARQAAIAQYERPGQREINAQRRREWWERHPELRAKMAQEKRIRAYEPRRLEALRLATKARREAKTKRRDLISERAQRLSGADWSSIRQAQTQKSAQSQWNDHE